MDDDDDDFQVSPSNRGIRVERRLHPRLMFSQIALIESSTTSCLATLVNMSSSGALIQAAPGVQLNRCQMARITLLDGTKLRCHIVWSGDRAVGVRFDQLVTEPWEHLDPEYLGRGIITSILRIQRQLAQTRLAR
jgi:PilZ domain